MLLMLVFFIFAWMLTGHDQVIIQLNKTIYVLVELR